MELRLSRTALNVWSLLAVLAIVKRAFQVEAWNSEQSGKSVKRISSIQ